MITHNVAHREALRRDEKRMTEIAKDEALQATIFGNDISAFQDLLRASFKVKRYSWRASHDKSRKMVRGR